ncbi:hypothetical protein O181_072987 [Austropuccinia psidii MF-1]|uniref:Uncharacterized protein n=1 Tax=Austropuccinia psidii MF-1 TaxID=1389203 RepID=A0A9Q3F871_9BASI|nr:hypothetical protein [Austropuccinia psidii MF-1]
MPKPLEGGNELLLTHQELSGSGEDHRALRRLEPIVLQRQSQKYKELVEEPKSSIHRPEEGIGNDSTFGEGRPIDLYQFQKISRKNNKPLTWFLKQKDRLSAINPDMSDSMIKVKVLRRCGGELEHYIKCRLSSNKDSYKEEFVIDQLVEAQINPSLSPRMRQELINVLYTYKKAFPSDNEPLGTINGHEVDITLDIDRPYPSVLRRKAYTASPRDREALEKHI